MDFNTLLDQSLTINAIWNFAYKISKYIHMTGGGGIRYLEASSLLDPVSDLFISSSIHMMNFKGFCINLELIDII